jgi:hypothetical protein
MRYLSAILTVFLMACSPALCADGQPGAFKVIKRAELVKPAPDGTIFVESDPIELVSRDVFVFASVSQLRRQDGNKNPPPEMLLSAFHILDEFHTRTFQTKAVSDGTQSMSVIANVPVVSPTMKFVVHAGGLDPASHYRVTLTVRDPQRLVTRMTQCPHCNGRLEQ